MILKQFRLTGDMFRDTGHLKFPKEYKLIEVI